MYLYYIAAESNALKLANTVNQILYTPSGSATSSNEIVGGMQIIGSGVDTQYVQAMVLRTMPEQYIPCSEDHAIKSIRNYFSEAEERHIRQTNLFIRDRHNVHDTPEHITSVLTRFLLEAFKVPEHFVLNKQEFDFSDSNAVRYVYNALLSATERPVLFIPSPVYVKVLEAMRMGI